MASKWTARCAEYLESVGGIGNDSVPKRQQYCADHDLSYNSFRREFAKYKSNLPDIADTAPKGDKPEKKQKGKGAGAQRQTSQPSDKSDQRGGDTARDLKAPDNGKQALKNLKSDLKKSPDVVRGDRPRRRMFTKGNQAALIHSGHSSQFFIDEDEAAYSTAGMDDVIGLMTRRLLSMEAIRTAKIRAVQKDYEEGNQHLREIQDPSGETIKVPMTFLEAIEFAEVSGLDILEKVVGRLSSAREKQHKISVDLHRLEQYNAQEIVEMTSTLLAKRESDELTASETCQLFYQEGIEPPALLFKEAELEIKNSGGGEVDDDGLSDDAIADLHKEAANRQEEHRAFREQREKDNNELLADLSGLGDVQVTEVDEDDE